MTTTLANVHIKKAAILGAGVMGAQMAAHRSKKAGD